MSKKFELSEPWDSVPTLSFDDVDFVKSPIDLSYGLLLCNIHNSALSFSFTFEVSQLSFSKQTIANEVFDYVSFSTGSGEFEYVFDNDEMLTQFCDFYGLEH
ncbi:hypothetical protein [Aliivibrio fischeri]|uniref:hypothetical protein n=1 Tax=Aliivibrio fischeri TaxID=668 RepID=UPI001F302DE6|nr:hypothetical protein [Aliivibrio fischeri]MCE7534847.1 hypothetical protein [Aliivibrio fischeri]MCE7557317.1 hypothetical protein [Aliivibrio fischeri]